ncbi:MAG: carbohydrate ABC transporter permease [Chloroflexota bacterium]|nr:carbohydrate ABC transporter permease [Chloroflexota bacterium]
MRQQSRRASSSQPKTAGLSKLVRRSCFYAAVLLLIVFYLFPSLYVLSTSLKLPVDYFTIPPTWIPTSLTLANYEKMFVDYQAGTALVNSLLIATLNTIVTLAMSIPVAYAIARYHVGGGALGFWIISQRMLPAVAIVIPFFLTFRALNLINTYHGLVIAYALFFIPFAVWMLLGFFEDFPQEIQDAALIDGCSELSTIVRIVIPILAGSIFVVALLLFVFTWNDLLIALVLTRAETRTMMVFFSATLVSPTQQDYGVAAGAVVVGMIPAYLFAVLGQRYLVRGLTMGGLKG